MHTFQTIKEFSEYVPQCLICKKELRLSFGTTYYGTNKSKPLVSFMFERKGNLLHSNHKQFKLVIDENTNEIMEGSDFFSKLIESVYVRKNCSTCHFKIHSCNHYPQQNREKNIFPDLTLTREELHFTMKGGKDISINKYYNGDDRDHFTKIAVNYKHLPNAPFYFDKLNSFEHLVKRIETIVTFQ